MVNGRYFYTICTHALKLYNNRPLTSIRKNFFSERVISVWNALPADVVDFASLPISKLNFRDRYAEQSLLNETTFDLDSGILVHLRTLHIKFEGRNSRSQEKKMFPLFGYGCTFRGDVSKLNSQRAAPNVNTNTIAQCSQSSYTIIQRFDARLASNPLVTVPFRNSVC